MKSRIIDEGGEVQAIELVNPVECLEAIGRWLAASAPEPWEEITIDFTVIEMDDVSEECIKYKPRGYRRGRLKQFFVDDTGLSECFFSLAKLTSSAEKGYFTKCRYVLSCDGKYTTSFEYADQAADKSLERPREG